MNKPSYLTAVQSDNEILQSATKGDLELLRLATRTELEALKTDLVKWISITMFIQIWAIVILLKLL